MMRGNNAEEVVTGKEILQLVKEKTVIATDRLPDPLSN